uniref:Uncharacterized protein n=1 Tax=Nelumbo nucifera TaxID=4432 RepID=A0A822XJF9_NELNU|nr:TPA_asm: hypothetical protein HUJ06_023127 [Nelumbo nucifera]
MTETGLSFRLESTASSSSSSPTKQGGSGGGNSSSMLVTKLISSECAKNTGYEKLPRSVRTTEADECGDAANLKKNIAWKFLSRMICKQEKIGDGSDSGSGSSSGVEGVKEDDGSTSKAEVKQKKKRSSWLPDPERRWPVQGW